MSPEQIQKNISSKPSKPTTPKKVATKTVGSKSTAAPKRVKVTATKSEAKAAGEKIMKKYSVAIKRLADR